MTSATRAQEIQNVIRPILALLFGTIPPYIISNVPSMLGEDYSLSEGTTKIDAVVTVLQTTMSLVSILFIAEFVFGGLARSKLIKPGFSPAAIHVAGVQPFELVEANRVHQNHFESAIIYTLASLSAACAGASVNILVATTITWVLSRIIYRFGYQQHHNPLWRLVGTFSSLAQSFICLGLFSHAQYASK